MTVGMRQLQAMSDSFINAHRDFKVAQDVGKMMELRRFEFETEVYATAYYQGDHRVYLVSKNDNAILGHIHDLTIKGANPLPLQSWYERQLVPAGLEEEIEQHVKVDACRHLRDTFPEQFWLDAQKVAGAPYVPGEESDELCPTDDMLRTDDGFCLLDYLASVIESSFNDDFLTMFDELVDMLYVRRSLRNIDYDHFKEWMREERQCMADELGERDLFSKEMYGFAYRKAGGQIVIQINASHKEISDKRNAVLRDGSTLVAPIFRRKCWYNYDYRLIDVRRDFKARLQRLYNDKYFSILEDVAALPVVVNIDEFAAVRDRLKA